MYNLHINNISCLPASLYLHITVPSRPRSISSALTDERFCVSLMQLPNGVTQSQAMYQDRFGKLQEHLRQLALLFRKLRLLYERCVEMTSDLQEGPAEVRRGEKNLLFSPEIFSFLAMYYMINLIRRLLAANGLFGISVLLSGLD